jgi:hypothetical protein
LLRSRLVGGVVRLVPVPGAVWWRLRLLKILKVRVVLNKMAAASVAQGGGACAPRSVDFRVVKGILPVQAFGGVAAGFAGVAACSMRTTKPELRGVSL